MGLELEELSESENGFKVTQDDDTEGPIYTGSPSVPFGLDFPINTVYTQVRPDGAVVWRKFGSDVNDWLVINDTHRSDTVDYDIKVPSKNVFNLNEREVNCELFIDGEVYVI